MRLLIDLGNTRLKWASSDPVWQVGAAALRGREIAELLNDTWRELPTPTAVFMVSVADRQGGGGGGAWGEAAWRLWGGRGGAGGGGVRAGVGRADEALDHRR